MAEIRVIPRKSIRAVPYNAGPHPLYPNNWIYWQVEVELDDEVNRGSHITDFTIYHDVEFREKFIDADQFEREQRDKVLDWIIQDTESIIDEIDRDTNPEWHAKHAFMISRLQWYRENGERT